MREKLLAIISQNEELRNIGTKTKIKKAKKRILKNIRFSIAKENIGRFSEFLKNAFYKIEDVCDNFYNPFVKKILMLFLLIGLLLFMVPIMFIVIGISTYIDTRKMLDY